MKRFFSLSLALLLCLSFLAGCGTTSVPPTPDPIRPVAVTDTDPHTELQNAYLADEVDSILDYARGKEELSRPRPVVLSWETGDLSAESYQVLLSTHADMTGAVEYTTEEKRLEVYNLLLGTTYYWCVKGGGVRSDISSFTTGTQAPRNLYVDGVTNVRDLGGWQTADGGRVKQGMLYRTGRLNESFAEEVTPEITPEGIAAFRALGIQTEIDLRRLTNGEYGQLEDSLIPDASLYAFPMEWDGNILTLNPDAVAGVFSLLADEDNYPIIFHCNIGTDRTGLIAFLLGALLGVAEEDLYRDYLFSNFAAIGDGRSADGIKNSYVATIKAMPGDTLAEKARATLLSVGVTEKEIASIEDIMKEPAGE